MSRFARVAIVGVLLSGGAVACVAPAAATAYCGGHKATIVVTGASPRVIAGTARNDVIAVTGGLHVVHGGAGNDLMCADSLGSTMFGDAGNDSLIGLGGNDQLTGGTGNDVLQGQAGNDTLDGQAGNDNLNGGSGVNGCDLDAADTTTHNCKFDMIAPKVTDFQVLTPTVNITTGHTAVQFQAHVTDNLSGTYEVTLQFCNAQGQDPLMPMSLYLDSGSATDGVWIGTMNLSNFTEAGAYTVCYVNTQDYATNLEFAMFKSAADFRKLPNSTFAFDVINNQTDHTAPVISNITTTPNPDVTSGDATVTTDFTVTEDGSGIRLVQFVLRQDFTGGSTQPQAHNVLPQLITPSSTGVSGSGRYRAVVQLPRGSAPGKWHVVIYVQDVVFNDRTSDTALNVVDRAPATTAPQVVSVTRTQGDTPRTQTYSLHITLTSAGVDSLQVHATGPNGQFANAYFVRATGTDLDGVWTATIQLPTYAAAGEWSATEWGTDKLGRDITAPAAPNWIVG